MPHPPAHSMQCAFLCDTIPDPVEMMAVRKALPPITRHERFVVAKIFNGCICWHQAVQFSRLWGNAG